MRRILGISESLCAVLRPFMPALSFGALLSSASGLVLLGALVSIVKMVGTMSAHWLIWALVLWILSAVCSAYSSWVCHHAEAKFAALLRRKLAAHLVRLPASTLTVYRGEKLRRLLSDDVAAMHHMIAHLPAEFANFIILPTATIYLLVSFSGWSGLLALIPGIVASFFYLIIVPRFAARQGAGHVNRIDTIASAIDDYARGIHICRIFGIESNALTDYRSSAKLFTEDMTERVARLALVVSIATALLQALATYAIAYTVGYQWGLETIAAVLFFSLAIVTPALKLGHGLDYVAAGRKAAGRLQEFLDQQSICAGEQDYCPDTSVRLQAEKLCFSLREQNILHDFSYDFPPGSITAITGVSGAGKTSLLRLFSGLEPPSSGRIYIDDKDYRDLSEKSRSRLSLLVPQGGDVLAASVQENLALSWQGQADGPYLSALDRVQLPVGLADDARQLSGGEKQRLNLARAFLTKAPIILLDEPTAGLDHQTALIIIDEIRKLSNQDGKTVIIVTHDPALMDQADDRISLPRCSHPEAKA